MIKLSWLNLSYNKIEYLQGFQDLWGPEYNLAIIQIHGNQIDSLDDIVKNLNGLSRLQHLTFRENPIAKKDAYRVTLFNRLRTLISLDGMDKHGKKDMNSQGLTGIEQYVGLTNDTREQLHDVTNSISHQYPKIAAALNALRHNPKPMESSTTTSVDIQNGSLSAVESECVPRSTKPTTRRPLNHDKRSARSPSTDNESDSMPIKTSRLKPRSTASNAVVQSTPRQQPTTTKKLSTKTHLTLNNSSSPPPPSNLQTKSHSMIDENTRPFSINSHQHLYNTTCEHDCDEYHYRSNRDNENDDMNEIYRATLHDLDNERDKRWRAEQEIKHLNDIINEFKNRPNDDRTNESIIQELTEKHKQRLVDEKSKFQDLTAILDDYKARLRSTEDQLSSYKKAHETNLQLIKTLESNLSKLESDKSEIRITENEKNRNWERRSNALQNEKEILQQELKTTKQQLRECQELYTTREVQHKQELEKCRIDLQATEVQQYLKQEIQRREDIHRTELTHQQEKLQSLADNIKSQQQTFNPLSTKSNNSNQYGSDIQHQFYPNNPPQQITNPNVYNFENGGLASIAYYDNIRARVRSNPVTNQHQSSISTNSSIQYPYTQSPSMQQTPTTVNSQADPNFLVVPGAQTNRSSSPLQSSTGIALPVPDQSQSIQNMTESELSLDFPEYSMDALIQRLVPTDTYIPKDNIKSQQQTFNPLSTKSNNSNQYGSDIQHQFYPNNPPQQTTNPNVYNFENGGLASIAYYDNIRARVRSNPVTNQHQSSISTNSSIQYPYTQSPSMQQTPTTVNSQADSNFLVVPGAQTNRSSSPLQSSTGIALPVPDQSQSIQNMTESELSLDFPEYSMDALIQRLVPTDTYIPKVSR
ncbi:unnamed protein product [Adineta steineri]|uniref:STI1 domain-containing protein n=1 Tax=Adineta steineri TaxID=433720 RepID=A0A814EG04_9BILA|nr:unnamed protein product [Adineta steineri]